jgi:endonuclease/exonuclease/phosphatase family metal-dependent hydrolase
MVRWGCLGLLVLSFAGAAEPAAPVLKVASLRLPAEPAQWDAQRARILAVLQELHPDVIAIQQVRQSADTPNPACWLASRLQYACDFITADPPSQPLRQGNALLSRDSVIEDGITLLHGADQFSAAGMQRLQRGSKTVNVYLVRIRPENDDAKAREHQTTDLRTWIAATGGGYPTLVAGDFSASTDELVQQLPGFQPARKNPAARRSDPIPGAPSGHGMDVLYQVRRFADVAQQMVRLPSEEGVPDSPRPLGLMVTIRLIEPDGADTPDNP